MTALTESEGMPNAVDLAYAKYGKHSVPLAAGPDNYLIVVDDALTRPPPSSPMTDSSLYRAGASQTRQPTRGLH